MYRRERADQQRLPPLPRKPLGFPLRERHLDVVAENAPLGLLHEHPKLRTDDAFRDGFEGCLGVRRGRALAQRLGRAARCQLERRDDPAAMEL